MELASRERGDAAAPPVLLVHGHPNSSYMWEDVLDPIADAGWYAIAPDLPGYGDSPPEPPGTWEQRIDALAEFVRARELDPVVLVTHDWGALIGLRWACDNPGAARALVISDSGFFPDGKWHGIAKVMRTPGEGEQLLEGVDRAGFGAMMQQLVPGLSDDAVDEYFKCYATPERRQAQLELYRSGDFEKLRPYEGRLAELGVPTLLLWGEDDPFAPVAGGHRLAREIPHAELVVLEGTGHWCVEEAPDRYAAELVAFLGELS